MATAVAAELGLEVLVPMELPALSTLGDGDAISSPTVGWVVDLSLSENGLEGEGAALSKTGVTKDVDGGRGGLYTQLTRRV